MVKFPYDPYDPQSAALQMLNANFTTDNAPSASSSHGGHTSQVLAVEMPTGTGKTLCLLQAALQAAGAAAAGGTGAGAGFSKKEQFGQNLLRKYSTQHTPALTTPATAAQQQQQHDSAVASGSDDWAVPSSFVSDFYKALGAQNMNGMIAAPTSALANKRRRTLHNQSFADGVEGLSDVTGGKLFLTTEVCSPPLVTIFYASRTHAQLAQVVKELAKFQKEQTDGGNHNNNSNNSSTNRNFHFRMNVMGSRDKYCVNGQVANTTQNRNNNYGEMCDKLVALDLCPHWRNVLHLTERRLAQGPNAPTTTSAASSSSGLGSFQLHRGTHNNHHQHRNRRENGGGCAAAPAVATWQIEDLCQDGIATESCPYYAAREMVYYADVNLCTYNYLLDPIIRHETKFEAALTNNSIIILDEAHNVADVCRDAFSAAFSYDEMCNGILWGDLAPVASSECVAQMAAQFQEPSSSSSASYSNSNAGSSCFAQTYPRSFHLGRWKLQDILDFLFKLVGGFVYEFFYIPMMANSAASSSAVGQQKQNQNVDFGAVQSLVHRLFVSKEASCCIHHIKKDNHRSAPIEEGSINDRDSKTCCTIAREVNSWPRVVDIFKRSYGVIMSLGVTFNPFQFSVHGVGVLKKWLLTLRHVCFMETTGAGGATTADGAGSGVRGGGASQSPYHVYATWELRLALPKATRGEQQRGREQQQQQQDPQRLPQQEKQQAEGAQEGDQERVETMVLVFRCLDASIGFGTLTRSGNRDTCVDKFRKQLQKETRPNSNRSNPTGGGCSKKKKKKAEDDLPCAVQHVVLASGTLGPLDQLAVDLLGQQNRKYFCTSPSSSGTSNVAVSSPPNAVVGGHVIDVSRQCLLAALHATTRSNNGGGGLPLRCTFGAYNTPSFVDSLAQTIAQLLVRCYDNNQQGRGGVNSMQGGTLVFFPNFGVAEKVHTACAKILSASSSASDIKLYLEPRKASAFDTELASYKLFCRSLVGGAKGATSSRPRGACFFAVFRGKLSEGINLPDETARLVLCVGVPYQPLKDEAVIAQRKHSGEIWYAIDAVRAVNQALGRCIRHAKDYGAMLLLDDRYTAVQRPAATAAAAAQTSDVGGLSSYLSGWARSQLRVFTDTNALCDQLGDFFRRTQTEFRSSLLDREEEPRMDERRCHEGNKLSGEEQQRVGRLVAEAGRQRTLSILGNNGNNKKTTITCAALVVAEKSTQKAGNENEKACAGLFVDGSSPEPTNPLRTSTGVQQCSSPHSFFTPQREHCRNNNAVVTATTTVQQPTFAPAFRVSGNNDTTSTNISKRNREGHGQDYDHAKDLVSNNKGTSVAAAAAASGKMAPIGFAAAAKTKQGIDVVAATLPAKISPERKSEELLRSQTPIQMMITEDRLTTGSSSDFLSSFLSNSSTLLRDEERQESKQPEIEQDTTAQDSVVLIESRNTFNNTNNIMKKKHNEASGRSKSEAMCID